MRITKYTSILSLIFILYLSCSSDNESSKDKIKNELIGKWVNISVIENGVELELDCPFSQITFTEDDLYVEEFIGRSINDQECTVFLGSIRSWYINDQGQVILPLRNPYFTTKVVLLGNQIVLTRHIFNQVTQSADNYIMTFIRD